MPEVSCTFCSLPSGEWGVRVVGIVPSELFSGRVLTAKKRNGDTKDVTITGVVLVKADAVVCTIADTRPVSRSRGYYRPRGEQASRASQSAPYDLATMTRAYETRRAEDALRSAYASYAERVEPAAEVQEKVQAAGADDLAALFSTLLAQPSNLDPESTLRKQ